LKTSLPETIESGGA